MTQKIRLEIITDQKAIDNERLEPAIVYIAALRGGFDTDSSAWSPPLDRQEGKEILKITLKVTYRKRF